MLFYSLPNGDKFRFQIDFANKKRLEDLFEHISKGNILTLQINDFPKVSDSQYDVCFELDWFFKELIMAVCSQDCKLVSLGLDWVPVFFPVGLYLEKILQGNHSIVYLINTRHVLAEKELQAIGRGMKLNTTVHTLNLTWCNIGRNGLNVMLKEMDGNTTLTVADLSYNHLLNVDLPHFESVNGFRLVKTTEEAVDERNELVVETKFRLWRLPPELECSEVKGSDFTPANQLENQRLADASKQKTNKQDIHADIVQEEPNEQTKIYRKTKRKLSSQSI